MSNSKSSTVLLTPQERYLVKNSWMSVAIDGYGVHANRIMVR
jgi:hypothetical protein